MDLTPREKDKLLLFTAGLLAERRKAKGLKLNHPEAVAYISCAILEGAREGRWVLLDYVDIVVHIQHQEERSFYALDRLWRDCPLVEVNLDDVVPASDGETP